MAVLSISIAQNAIKTLNFVSLLRLKLQKRYTVLKSLEKYQIFERFVLQW